MKQNRINYFTKTCGSIKTKGVLKMNGKRIFAFICSLILAGNYIPFTAFSVDTAEESKKDTVEKIETTMIILDEDFANDIIVENKIYDGTTKAMADFSKVVLNGKAEEDEVVLTAKAEFAEANAGENKTVVISDFKLSGDDSEKYTLLQPLETKVLANISPKTIILTPETTFIKGAIPDKVAYTYDKNDIVGNVNITASITVEETSSGYEFKIDDPTLTGNPNYIVAINDGMIPSVNMPNAPQVIPEAVVKKVDEEIITVDADNDSRIATKGSAKLCVSAESDYQNIPVTFTLPDGKEVTVKTGDLTKNKKYLYTAEFILNPAEDGNYCRYKSLYCTVDNGSSSGAYLKFKTEYSDKIYTELLFDKKEPEIKEMAVTYNNSVGFFQADGKFEDNESRIKKVEYKWDDGEWVVFFSDSGSPSSLDFKNVVPYYMSQDVSFRGGKHMLYLKITDYAGNVAEENGVYCDWETGSDTRPPEIKYIRLETDDGTPVSDCIVSNEYGNFINKNLNIVIGANDTAESPNINGIECVAILDDKGGYAKEKQVKQEKYGEYTFEFDLAKDSELIIEDCYIRLADREYVSEISLKEALQEYPYAVAVEDETTEGEAETTTENEAEITGSDIDRTAIKSNRWVFDTKAPEIKDEWFNSITDNDEKYFGNSDNDYEAGKLTINITDNGGLDKLEIKQQYMADSKNVVDKETSIEISELEKTPFGYNYVVDTSKLETGFYKVIVSACDYAGNAKNEVVYAFYVDHELPQGIIETISPLTTEIDEKIWISEKDEDGKGQDVVFRVYPSSEGSAVKSVKMIISGENGEKSETFEADKFIIDESTGKPYVELAINTDEFKCIQEDNTYNVKAEICSVSGNKGEAEYTLYVDREAPEVNSFTVSQKNSEAENVMNVLPFGVFAKDSLVLNVEANDGINDSGIEKVVISYTSPDGKAVADNMVYDETTKLYSYELECTDEIFSSDIDITVYDKIGKTNLECPNIKNAENTYESADNRFVMIETAAPSIILDLPETDSVMREDGQIWYRYHNGSELDRHKSIVIKIQDENSGIRCVSMLINNVAVNAELKDGNEAVIKEFPTIKSTSEAGKSECGILEYSFSLEKIAEIIPANEDGSYIIGITAVDNAGNICKEPVNSKGEKYTDNKPVYYRDIVKPIVTQFAFNPATADEISAASEFVEELEYGFYFKKGFEASVFVTDDKPSSQLDKAIFTLIPYENGTMQEAKPPQEVKIIDGRAVCEIPSGFKGQIYAEVYDKVGNVSDRKTPQGFVVDEVAPTITIEELPDTAAGKDEKGNKLYNTAVQYRVTISDYRAGLKEVSYSKSSERDSREALVNVIDNVDGHLENKLIANGWEITKNDVNLITEVSQVFTFNSDDNDIIMTFNAKDRAMNACEPMSSEAFSIDTIAPEISISNNSELINDMYYRNNTSFTITVTERNFDAGMMSASISNGFTGAIPTVSFQKSNSNPNVYTAVVAFAEGDYSFSFSGKDRAGHAANISYNGGEKSNSFYEIFNVDATVPKIKTNFKSFGKDEDDKIYFNSEQIAKIEVTEHNFNASDMGVSVEEKEVGTSHTSGGNWRSISYYSDWVKKGDTYTLEIPFKTDGVYRVSLSPKDRAGNVGTFEEGSVDHTPVYEIDRTSPIVTARNGKVVKDSETKFLDVYGLERRNEESPTVEFDDINFDHLEYSITRYTPVYKSGKELDEVKPDEVLNQIHKDKKFTLPEFKEDGVYAVTITAYDKAGNASVLNENTYMRMVDSDVLAYIEKSNSKDKSGWYSFADENGPISKRPDSFSDLSIIVLSKSDCNADIVLRNENENEVNTGIKAENLENIYGVGFYRYTLPGSYFAENYTEDADTRLYLRVNNDNKHIELGEIYIDNTIPTCDIPEDFKNWGWFFGSGSQTIVFENVSEILDREKSVAYVDGKKIPLDFSEDNKTVSLKLDAGSYSVGLSLVDRAGNTYNIPEVTHLAIGNNRLWIILGISAAGIVLIVLTICIVRGVRRRRAY